MDKKISEYMSKIGKKGGKKSRRKLTPEQSKKMNEARWSKHKKDAGKAPKQKNK